MFLGQSLNRLNKKVITEHSELVEIRQSKGYKLNSVKLLTDRAALVTYEPLDDRIKAYKNGCLVVPALVTALSRIYLTQLVMKFEANHYVVAYTDTGKRSI